LQASRFTGEEACWCPRVALDELHRPSLHRHCIPAASSVGFPYWLDEMINISIGQ